MSRARGGRRGFVLLTVLLALMLVSVALAGVLTVAGHEAALGQGEAAVVRARLAAEGAARLAVADWVAVDALAIPVGGAAALAWSEGPSSGTLRWHAEAERLTPGSWRVVGRSEVGPVGRPVARGLASLLVLVPPAPGLWAAFPAALVAAAHVNVAATGLLDGTSPPPVPCGAAAAAVDAAAGGVPVPALVLAAGGTLAQAAGGEVVGGWRSEPGMPAAALAGGLGPVGRGTLEALADRVETGAVALAPVAAGGVCATASPGNWGAPLDPAHACAGWIPVVHAPGDLTVAAGAGEAVLMVEGDLVVRSGATVLGAVLVLGSLTVEAGAVVRGGVRAAGAVEIGGRVERDACALHRVVTGSGLGTRAFRPAGRWWLPVF